MKNHHQPPLAELGEFVVVFQAVEAEVTDMIEFVIDGDPEYTHARAAELEFSSKRRALDVIFTRWARMNQVTDQPPHLLRFGGIANVLMLPAPAWFSAADLLLAHLPAASLGQMLAARSFGHAASDA